MNFFKGISKSFEGKPDKVPVEKFMGAVGSNLVSDSGRNYIIEKKIGSGGFANVYLVNNGRNKSYALKILRMWNILPEERQEILYRFDREYTCSCIDSSYLVRSYDKGTHLGNPFFVMEYCPNGNLGEMIGKSIQESVYREVGIRILKGLRDLHKEGIIHRDLKPVNVLFDKNNDPRLTDFGISGFLKSRITVRNWLGHVKKIFGTVVYMPPEQLNAREAFLSLGPVTDLFAFGVTMHELISGGELPYGQYVEAEEDAYLKDLISGNSKVFRNLKKRFPALWSEIIEGCIQPDPSIRFNNAETVLSMLESSKNTGAPKISKEYSKGIEVLKIKQGEEHNRIYNLTEMRIKKKSNLLTVGWYDENRPDLNDINILESMTTYVSQYHATLEYNQDEERWYIRDGQWRTKNNVSDWFLSTNGVLVNSDRVTEEGCAIRNGDIITIGDTTLRFEII